MVRVTVTGDTNSAPVVLTRKSNNYQGTLGEDHISGRQGKDVIRGLDGADELFGGSGRDRLYGGDGMDWLNGGRGRDWLDGGNGNDTLKGGTGRDILIGGQGQDIMTGGHGRDTFVFQASDEGAEEVDTITDFRNNDRIQLADDMQIVEVAVANIGGGADIDTVLKLSSGASVQLLDFSEYHWGLLTA